MKTPTGPLNASETATVLAALRLWQETANAVEEFPEHFTDAKPLDADEIGVLCDRINFGGLAVTEDGTVVSSLKDAALRQIHKAYGALTAGLIAKRALGLRLSRSEQLALDEYEGKA